MKLIATASLAFKELEPIIQASFGNNVVICLTKYSAQFPNLPITVTGLQTLNDNLANAVQDAASGSYKSISALKPVRSAWKKGFSSTAKYVTFMASISNFAEGTIGLAGFTATKSQSQPRQVPAGVPSFDATIAGDKGSITAGSKRAVRDALAFVFAVIPDGVEIRQIGNTMKITVGDKTLYMTTQTKRKATIEGLTSHTPYNVSMYAINSAGCSPISKTKKVTPQ
jgi:hypothetical protein